MISVIIPVYNVQDYLRDCLDSLVSQKYQDYEVILVDDGSDDKSPDICDEYSSRYSRIRVIHKNNGGVSSARNAGLDVACGEYIAFIDADDYVNSDFLNIEGYNSDVIEKGYCVIDPENKILCERKQSLCESLDTDKQILRFFVNERNNALWDKIIARRVILEKRFNENVKIGEDFLFFLTLIPNIKSYAFSSIGTYFYRKTASSAMNTINCDLSKRLQVIEENIANIFECNKCICNENLMYSIIFQSYFPYYYKYRKCLTVTQLKQYQNLLCSFSIDRIMYLSTYNKIKIIGKITLSAFHLL